MTATAPWVPSPNYYRGRRQPIRWLVWHSTEGAERPGAALQLALGWFGRPEAQVSAHVIADADQVVECVKPEDTAWHCANGNAAGYGLEIVGRAGQTEVDWSDDYSLAALGHACAWVKSLPQLAHVPRRWLSNQELRNGQPGMVTHYQVGQVLGGTTHTDPGAHFPFAWVEAQFAPGQPFVPRTPSPRPAPPLPTLRYGDRSPEVLRLHEFLVRVFPSYATFTPTGFYGTQTRAAVREFQARAGVQGSPLDGSIVGPATNAALARYGYRG